MKQPLKCPQCGYANEPNSKFCQECGKSLVAPSPASIKATEPMVGPAPVQRVAVEGDIPTPALTGITVEFPFSTSQSFDFAVKEAAKLVSFAQYGEGKKALYRVNVLPQEMGTLIPLLEQLKGWRHRVVYVNGEKAPWDSVFSFLWCYGKRQGSYKPEYYCFGYENEWQFNIWGCIQANLPFVERGGWFCWGRFLNSKGDWAFDKARIAHELQKTLFPYRFCPALDGGRVDEVLRLFPDQVSPQKDKDWQFVEDWGDTADTGLVMTLNRFGTKEQVKIKGVSPKGKGAVEKIMKQMKLKLPAR